MQASNRRHLETSDPELVFLLFSALNHLKGPFRFMIFMRLEEHFPISFAFSQGGYDLTLTIKKTESQFNLGF